MNMCKWIVLFCMLGGMLWAEDRESLPTFDPKEFKTLTCEEIVTHFTEERDIPYYDAERNEADAYLAEKCLLDVFYPTHRTGVPVLIYYHGGGLSGGSKDWKMELYKHLGCVIVTPGYRLSPTVTCPAYIEDAAAAAAWVKENIARYNGDPNQVFVTGHSAGAYLATCLAVMPRFLGAYGLSPHDFQGYISISGEMVTHRAVVAERGLPKGQILIDEYAPIYHVAADLPPMILLTGGAGLDIGSRVGDNKLMAEALRAAGHTRSAYYEVPGTNHGSIMDAAYAYLLQFIRETVQKAD